MRVIRKPFLLVLGVFLIGGAVPSRAATAIPSQAWSRDVAAVGNPDGAPIGGFGAGTITWRNNGAFYLTRLNISAGNDSNTNAVWNNDPNAAFFYYSKPTAGGSAATAKLDSTLTAGQATYYALFPKAWVDYYGSKFPVKARVTQFSPLIPGDYQRVSYPEGIYEWELSNPSAVSQDVAVMLTFDNTFSGTTAALASGGGTGLVLGRGVANATAQNQGEFCLASLTQTGVSVTRQSAASQAALVTAFNANGTLADSAGANTIGGLAIKATLAPGASVRVPIVLAWDIPITQVGTGNKWYREYTRTFGRSGLNSWAIAQDALAEHAAWEAQLDAWQGGILSNAAYPDWLKSMLFNELYIYFTAGSVWEAGAASGQADDPTEDMFSHMESYIYPFYGTSDVRFYGSWALFLNWPDIDKQAVRQFSDSVTNARADRPAGLGTTAHDFGDNTNLFTRWNAYVYRDSTTWKDLNSKFVLMCYRDYKLTGATDSVFLNYVWPSVKIAMAKVKSQDTDGDGLPNSTGIDQTYDDMDLTGNTAYCGGLFLAACQAAQQLALAEGDGAQAASYQSWFNQGQASYESELWTGSYYKIDTGSVVNDRIMSDQLCGQWYSKALGLGGIVSDPHAAAAFQKIYDNNFMRFDTGNHAIVNVMTAAGAIDTSTPQTQECWVGTTWGATAGMVFQGLTAQAGAVGQSLYNTIYSTGQYWFRTPEAWRTGLGSPRAFYYMRGTTLWGVKQAIDCMALPVATATPSVSPSRSPSPSPSTSVTLSPSLTASPSATPTPSASASLTVPISPSATPTPSASASLTVSISPSATPTPSASASLTVSISPSATPTPSASASLTVSISPSATPTPSATLWPSVSASPTETGTPPPCTASPTATATGIPPSATVTPFSSQSSTAAASPSSTLTPSATTLPSAGPSATVTQAPSPTASANATAAPTGVATPSLTDGPTIAESPAVVSGEILALVPQPNPQSGPGLDLQVRLSGPVSLLRCRVYTKALRLLGAQDLGGAFTTGWNQVHVPLSLPSEGIYFVQVAPSNGGQARRGRLAKVYRLR